MGQSSTKQSEVIDDQSTTSPNAGQNGGEAASPKEKPTLGHRRTSFYETVDANEVLPYLIIGKS